MVHGSGKTLILLAERFVHRRLVRFQYVEKVPSCQLVGHHAAVIQVERVLSEETSVDFLDERLQPQITASDKVIQVMRSDLPPR